jgi:SAM-dependent methyltransferase
MTTQYRLKKPQPGSFCPLCHQKNLSHFAQHGEREYRLCHTCHLIFVSAEQHLSAAEEKARYDQHNNGPDDQNYRAFLSRMFIPMQERLAPKSCGLDFGSGPGPTLSRMFEEAGYRMRIYDPFYAPDLAALDQSYDFITATEVVEHLHHPGFELERLWSLLTPGGLLGIMTQLVPDPLPFTEWHYLRDPTHVCFFSSTTGEWLAKHWQAAFTCMGNSVLLFSKQKNSPDISR